MSHLNWLGHLSHSANLGTERKRVKDPGKRTALAGCEPPQACRLEPEAQGSRYNWTPPQGGRRMTPEQEPRIRDLSYLSAREIRKNERSSRPNLNLS